MGFCTPRTILHPRAEQDRCEVSACVWVQAGTGSWKGSCKRCACTLGACKGRRMLTEGLKEEQGLNLCMGTAPGASPRPPGTHCGTAGCLLPHGRVLPGAPHCTVAHQEPRGAAQQALKIRRGIRSDLWCLSRADFNTGLCPAGWMWSPDSHAQRSPSCSCSSLWLPDFSPISSAPLNLPEKGCCEA